MRLTPPGTQCPQMSAPSDGVTLGKPSGTGGNNLKASLIIAGRYSSSLTLCIIISSSFWNLFRILLVARSNTWRLVARRYVTAGRRVATVSVPAAMRRLASETISVPVMAFSSLCLTIDEMKSGHPLSMDVCNWDLRCHLAPCQQPPRRIRMQAHPKGLGVGASG